MFLVRKALNVLAIALVLVGAFSVVIVPFTLIAWAIGIDNAPSGWKFVVFHGAGVVLLFLGIGLGKVAERSGAPDGWPDTTER